MKNIVEFLTESKIPRYKSEFEVVCNGMRNSDTDIDEITGKTILIPYGVFYTDVNIGDKNTDYILVGYNKGEMFKNPSDKDVIDLEDVGLCAKRIDVDCCNIVGDEEEGGVMPGVYYAANEMHVYIYCDKSYADKHPLVKGIVDTVAYCDKNPFPHRHSNGLKDIPVSKDFDIEKFLHAEKLNVKEITIHVTYYGEGFSKGGHESKIYLTKNKLSGGSGDHAYFNTKVGEFYMN